MSEKPVASSLAGEAPPEPTLEEMLLAALKNHETRMEALEKHQGGLEAMVSDFMVKLQKAAEAGPPPQTQLQAPSQGGGVGSLMQLIPELLGGDSGGGGDAAFAQIGKDMFQVWYKGAMRLFSKQMGIPEHVTVEG